MNKKMKRGLIFVLVFMMLCNPVSFGRNIQTVHAENEITNTNIIVNGNFEDGTVMDGAVTSQGSSVASSGTIGDSGWTWYTGLAGASFQVIGEPGNEQNNKVLKMSHSSSGGGTAYRTYDTALTSGETYKITVKVKAQELGNTGYLTFKLNDTKMDVGTLYAKNCGAGWYEHSFEYTLPKTDAKKKLEIVMGGMVPGGYWLIDDVSLEAVVKVTGISLNKQTMELTKGAEETLSATVAPENATDKTVLWKSNNDAIATVDDTGKVTAVAKGEAIITATSKADSTISAICTVTVTEAEDGAGNTNIIVNGNFEDGTVMDGAVTSQGSSVASSGTIGDSGWTWYTGLAGASFQVIGEPGNEQNNKVLKMSHSSSGGGTAYRTYDTALTSGETYKITVKVKAQELGNTGYLVFKLNDTKMDVGTLYAKNCGAGWYEHSFEYTLPKTDAKKKLEIVMGGMVPGGYWLIDDVSLVEISSSETTPVVSVNGENYDGTLQEAINEAANSAVITLLDNIDLGTSGIEIKDKNVTIDLSGNTLKAAYFVSFEGTHVIDSSDGKTGRLNVPANMSKLSPTNSQVPVYSEDGYMFADMTAKEIIQKDADSFNLVFKPLFGAINSELANGADAADIEFIIRLDWTQGDTAKYQEFVYIDDLVKQVYGASKAFSVAASDLSAYSDMKVTALVRSTGLEVEWVNSSFNLTETDNQ